MRRQPPPLRFLTLTVGLWVSARVVLLAPDWWVAAAPAEPAAPAGAASQPKARAFPKAERPLFVQVPMRITGGSFGQSGRHPSLAMREPRPEAPAPALFPLQPASSSASATMLAEAGPVSFPGQAQPLPQNSQALHASPAPNRWSGSAWFLLRDDRRGGLAPGGTLGGSQSGVRIAWRFNTDPARPLALFTRLHAPVSHRAPVEAALGLDWRPSARVPVHLLAERRQRLGREGRSAFALSLHGGVTEQPLPAGFRLDAYGQAGIVGTRSRDLFADGAARLSLPVTGRLSIGAGLWGGAQPGASRLDAGPQVSLRLPIMSESVRLTAEYRLRLAGDARPGSGPALTLGTDF